MQSAVILFCTLHYTIMDEDHRLKCGKMLQLESGQIIFLCKICSGEFISLGLFVRHHRMIHGAIQLQPLQQKNTCEATRWQPSPQTVTHGAVKLQSLQQKITHGATRLPQLTQTVTHSAVKLQPLQQKMTSGAIKLKPLQLKTTLGTTRLQPSPQTVTHATVKLQQKIRYGAIPMQPLNHRIVTQGAVQPTIAGSLTEKKYPLVVIKRSVPPATQTTSAKKSAPIPPYSSDRDETISFRKLLGYKSPQEETQLRKEFDTEIHRDTCKPKARIKCDYCSKTYLSAGGLRIHMHRHHKLNIPFLCDACPKAFNLPSELTLHRLTHGIERNILCDFCDQQFLTKYQRGIHVKCDHANETYRCTVCFFDSKVLGVVRRHQSLAHGI